MNRPRLSRTGLSSPQLLAVGLVILMLVITGCFGLGGDQDNRVPTTANGTATVQFKKQSTNGTTVTVQSVSLPDGGYVAIHDLREQKEDAIGNVIGVSGYLKAGTHKNVPVGLFEVPGGHFRPSVLQHNQTLIAVVHHETSENTSTPTFDFVTTNGREDDPYSVNDHPVKATAFIIVHPHANATATQSERHLSATSSGVFRLVYYSYNVYGNSFHTA
jgi:hypothetical protein